MTASVEHPENTYTYQEATAGPDGSFSFDFGDRVDWDYGDRLWVSQYLNANGCVTITQDSPEMVVIAPGSVALPAD